MFLLNFELLTSAAEAQTWACSCPHPEVAHETALHSDTIFCICIYIQLHKNIYIQHFNFDQLTCFCTNSRNVRHLTVSYIFLSVQDCVALCACLRIRKVVSLTSDQEIKRCQNESGKEHRFVNRLATTGAPFKSKKPHKLHTCCSTPAQRQLVSLHHNRLPCLDLFGLSTSGDLGIKH